MFTSPYCTPSRQPDGSVGFFSSDVTTVVYLSIMLNLLFLFYLYIILFLLLNYFVATFMFPRFSCHRIYSHGVVFADGGCRIRALFSAPVAHIEALHFRALDVSLLYVKQHCANPLVLLGWWLHYCIYHICMFVYIHVDTQIFVEVLRSTWLFASYLCNFALKVYRGEDQAKETKNNRGGGAVMGRI